MSSTDTMNLDHLLHQLQSKLGQPLEMPVCSQHPEKTVMIHCTSCEQFICAQCMVSLHMQHPVKLIDDLVQDAASKMTDCLPLARMKLREWRAVDEALLARKFHLRRNQTEVLTQLSSHYFSLMEKLERWYKDCKMDAKRDVERCDEALRSGHGLVRATRTALQQHVQMLDCAYQTGNAVEVCRTHEGIVSSLKTLLQRRPQLETEPLVELDFRPGLDWRAEMFGRVHPIPQPLSYTNILESILKEEMKEAVLDLNSDEEDTAADYKDTAKDMKYEQRPTLACSSHVLGVSETDSRITLARSGSTPVDDLPSGGSRTPPTGSRMPSSSPRQDQAPKRDASASGRVQMVQELVHGVEVAVSQMNEMCVRVPPERPPLGTSHDGLGKRGWVTSKLFSDVLGPPRQPSSDSTAYCSTARSSNVSSQSSLATKHGVQTPSHASISSTAITDSGWCHARQQKSLAPALGQVSLWMKAKVQVGTLTSGRAEDVKLSNEKVTLHLTGASLVTLDIPVSGIQRFMYNLNGRPQVLLLTVSPDCATRIRLQCRMTGWTGPYIDPRSHDISQRFILLEFGDMSTKEQGKLSQLLSVCRSCGSVVVELGVLRASKLLQQIQCKPSKTSILHAWSNSRFNKLIK